MQATSPELTLLMVNRRMFNATIGDAIALKRKDWEPFLKEVSIFGMNLPPPQLRPSRPRCVRVATDLTEYDRFLVADCIQTRTYEDGAIVSGGERRKDGDKAGDKTEVLFYIVVEGTVESKTEKRSYERHHFFGQAFRARSMQEEPPSRCS